MVEVVWGCCVHGNFGGAVFAIDYPEEAVVGDEEVRVPFEFPMRVPIPETTCLGT